MENTRTTHSLGAGKEAALLRLCALSSVRRAGHNDNVSKPLAILLYAATMETDIQSIVEKLNQPPFNKKLRLVSAMMSP